MWIAFGQGGNFRWIPVHKVVNTISPESASGLLFIHAFTGYKAASAFRGKGTKSAWKILNVHKGISTIFTKLSQFIVAMYKRSNV